GEEIIVAIPWEEWWELALKDSSNPQIALLPLHPEIRAKFNSIAAWEYTRSMSGKPYGYHNMIFSWIEAVGDNYPPPLDAHLVRLKSVGYLSMNYSSFQNEMNRNIVMGSQQLVLPLSFQCIKRLEFLVPFLVPSKIIITFSNAFVNQTRLPSWCNNKNDQLSFS
ncbi:hypothetical protein CR513_06204, partial [Mucuna pruriens]